MLYIHIYAQYVFGEMAYAKHCALCVCTVRGAQLVMHGMGSKSYIYVSSVWGAHCTPLGTHARFRLARMLCEYILAPDCVVCAHTQLPRHPGARSAVRPCSRLFTYSYIYYICKESSCDYVANLYIANYR